MRVRYLVSMAGTDFSRNVGDESEIDNAEGERLKAAGYVEEVVEAKESTERPAEKKKSEGK